MADLNQTQFFKVPMDADNEVAEALKAVCEAMEEKGYDPVNQIVGYLMSGDPTYITSHKGARNIMMKVERDELMEELMQFYLAHKWE